MEASWKIGATHEFQLNRKMHLIGERLMNAVSSYANNLTNPITERLLRLVQLYQTHQASPLMERTINKLFAHELAESDAQLNQLQADLIEFENLYQMSSEEFYTRYQAGKTDDRMDFIEWASLIQMVANLQQRIRLLKGEPVS